MRLSPRCKKNVIIKTIGPITVMGNISGPILKPFKVTINDIMHLLVTNYEVHEVLNNGKKIKLNLENYNLDNNIKPKVEEKPNVQHQKENVNKKNEEIKPEENTKKNKHYNNNINKNNDKKNFNNKNNQ